MTQSVKRYLKLGLVLSVGYLLVSFLLIGFKPDQLVLVLIFNTLLLSSSSTRKFIFAFSPFIIFWILFDYMKAFPNYLFNEVHIRDLYYAERFLFGIKEHGSILIPGEFCNQHHFLLADIASGLFYLCWIPVPLAFTAFLFAHNRPECIHFVLTFLLVNLIGFVIYYCFPAAPPWYVQLHGFVFDPKTAGNVAGLMRFDHFFNTHLFQGLYGKSSNVFAAMPSLHSAYPVIVLYFGLKIKLGWANVGLAIITLGIWCAAVYTNHHYILDVLAGITTALAGITMFRIAGSSLGFVRNPVGRYIEHVS